jgi:hypothetical protein
LRIWGATGRILNSLLLSIEAAQDTHKS